MYWFQTDIIRCLRSNVQPTEAISINLYMEPQMEYYNVESILAEEEKLNVKFAHDIQNFGFYISPTLNTIKKDTKVDLPFFLVKFLILNEYCHIVEHPVKSVKFELDACSAIVDLKCRHFYSIGMFIYDRRYLCSVFFERIGSFVPILLKGEFSEDDVSRLSSEERRMIISARKCYVQFEEFYKRCWDVNHDI